MQIRGRKQVMAVGGTVVAMALSLAACSSSTSTPSSSSTSATSASSPTSSAAALSGTINGSGSTFQLTFQQAAIQAYKSVQSGVTVNYSGVGSGTGRTNLAANTTNFAGSDSTIPSSEEASFKGKTVLYFPVLIGPITMSYNLSGVSNLKLTPTVIAKIFSGKITNWDNSEIQSLQASNVKLPNEPMLRASDSR